MEEQEQDETGVGALRRGMEEEEEQVHGEGGWKCIEEEQEHEQGSEKEGRSSTFLTPSSSAFLTAAPSHL